MFTESAASCFGVVPVLVGPLQVILTVLPGILLAMLGAMVRLLSPTGFRNALRLAWQQKIMVVCLALAVGGGVYGWRTLFPPRETVTDEEQGSDWPCARCDLRRSGAVAGSESPTVARVVWNFRSEFGFFASPAVVGNRVYISAVRMHSFQAARKGEIFCLDADTGGVVWTCSPKNYRPTFSSPVVAGNYLVCGEGLHETYDARVVCLDVRPQTKDKDRVLWTFETRNHVECTPAIYKDRVYFGAGDDGIYCLELEPESNGKAKMVWHIPNTIFVGRSGKQFRDDPKEYGLRNPRFQPGGRVAFRTETKDGKDVPNVLRLLEDGETAGEGMSTGTIKKKDVDNRVLTVVTPEGKERELTIWEFPDCETSLAVHDGKVYFGLGNDGKALAVIDADTGKELKRIAMKYPVFGLPSIAHGKLYVGTGEGDYGNAEPEPETGEKRKEGGQVVCVDLEKLAVDWTFDRKKTILGAVAIKEEPAKQAKQPGECKLYFGCGDGSLYCLSDKGQVIGKYDVPGGGGIKTSPAVTDKAVYIVTEKGLLVGLNRKTLTPQWDYRLGPAESAQGFISSPTVARGHVYVGTLSDGFFCVGEVKTEPFWPNPLGGPDKSGNDDGSFFPDTLPEIWAYPGPAASAAGKVQVTAPVAAWKDTEKDATRPADLYVPLAGPGDKFGIACLPSKFANGKPRPSWFFETPGAISQSPVVLGGSVLAMFHSSCCSATAAADASLICLDRASGKLKWEKRVASGILTVTPRQILVQGAKDWLTSLDPSGKLEWSRPIGSLMTVHEPKAQARVHPHEPAAQARVDQHEPNAQARKDDNPLLAPQAREPQYFYPMAASNILVVATPKSAPELGLGRKPALLALDRGSGTLLWSVALDGPPCSSPYVIKSTIYLGTPTGLEARSLIDGEIVWDCQAGPPSAELAMGDGTISYVNQAGELVVVNRDNGSVKGRVGGVLPGFPPLPSRDVALVVTRDGLAQASFEKDSNNKITRLKLEAWAETSTLGRPAGPIVCTGLNLFVPTVDRGLVCIGGKQ